MKIIFYSILTGLLCYQSALYAQQPPANKPKSEEVAKKKQTRAEFNASILALYKTHRQEIKELQINHINKQFNEDFENEKAITELKNKILPTNTPDKNKEVVTLIEKKGKEYQEKFQKQNEELFGKIIPEKMKAFHEMTSKLNKEFEESQMPKPAASPQQPPAPNQQPSPPAKK